MVDAPRGPSGCTCGSRPDELGGASHRPGCGDATSVQDWIDANNELQRQIESMEHVQADLRERIAKDWPLLVKARAQQGALDEALTLLADAISHPEGAIPTQEWDRRMIALAALLDDGHGLSDVETFIVDGVTQVGQQIDASTSTHRCCDCFTANNLPCCNPGHGVIGCLKCPHLWHQNACTDQTGCACTGVTWVPPKNISGGANNGA